MIYKVKSRETDKTDELNSGIALSFLYNTLLGRLILKILTMKFITDLGGLYMNSKLSKHKIKKFIKNLKIRSLSF